MINTSCPQTTHGAALSFTVKQRIHILQYRTSSRDQLDARLRKDGVARAMQKKHTDDALNVITMMNQALNGLVTEGVSKCAPNRVAFVDDVAETIIEDVSVCVIEADAENVADIDVNTSLLVAERDTVPVAQDGIAAV